MNVFIPTIDLSFGDFILLAILLALMYGLTGLELALSLPRKDCGPQKSDRRKAAGWAFVGILVTIVAGVAAGAKLGPAEPALLLLPLLFMARWAYYHWASATLPDVQAVRLGLEDLYSGAVLASLAAQPRSAEEIFVLALKRVGSSEFIECASNLTRGIVPVPARALVDELLFSPRKVDAVLKGLVSGGFADKTEAGYVRRYPRDA